MLVSIQHERIYVQGFGGPHSLQMPRNIVNTTMYANILESLAEGMSSLYL